MSLILTPFSWLLNNLNMVFSSYGIAIMVFAVFVKILLFPFSIKGKRGMIAMNMISGEMAKLKKQYGKDPQRYNQEVQDLYLREKVNPLGGCLWSLLPLFVLLPLYAIIREPVENIIGLSEIQVFELANLLDWDNAAVDLGMVTQDIVAKAQENNLKNGITSGFDNSGYNQLFLASLIPETGVILESGQLVENMNFHLMGIDLTKVPNWRIWQDFSLQNLATLLLVAFSALSGVFFSRITQKTNKMSNPNQPTNPQTEQTQKMMMYMMPVMSVWIGLIMPSIMVVYWISNNLLSMVQEVIAGKILKKDYEAMRERQAREAKEAKEEEKRLKEEKVKAIEAKKLESNQKKGGKKKKKAVEEPEKVDKDASREGMRPYARGRAYDPDRYPNPNPEEVDEEEKEGEIEEKETKSEEKTEKKKKPKSNSSEKDKEEWEKQKKELKNKD